MNHNIDSNKTLTPYFFLDDERIPWKVTHVELPNFPWTICRSYSQFVKLIEEYWSVNEELPKFISFDHDLADEHYRKSMYDPDKHYNEYYTDGTFREKTGFCAAKWLINFCEEKDVDLPEFICHSMNPLGKENILSILNSYKQHREYRKINVLYGSLF